MDKETQNIIKERFSTLAPDVKKAISDANLSKRVEDIASKNNLHIDQSGALITEVYLVMLGMEKSEDFTRNISKNLSISFSSAAGIAGDINREIFLPIRQSLMEMSKARDAIEENANSQEGTTNLDRDAILHDIENPRPTPERGMPITDPSREISARSVTEGFIANKLGSSSVSSSETTTIKVPPNANQKKYSTDPYREPIN